MADLKYYRQRAAFLEKSRDRKKGHWKEIAENFLPHRGRFNLDEESTTRERYADLLNNKPTMSMRVLSAGLMSGMTSPARPWFRLSTGSEEMDNAEGVKAWLFACRTILLNVFAKSNLYNSLQTFYNETCTFATGALGMYEDDDTFLRFETLTAGQYALGLSEKGEVDTLVLRRKRTVSSIVKEFGEANTPQRVLDLWKRGDVTERFEVVVLVEPNDSRGGTKFAYDLPFRRVTWIEGVGDVGAVVQESGHHEFPFAAARWDLAPGEVYGTDSPAFAALGDAKSLQLVERDILQIANRIADPAILADKSLRRSLGDRAPVPGTTHFVDNPDVAIKALSQDGRTALSEMSSLAQRQEQRISAAFYEDMFLMMASSDRREITAREVAERHEEKLLQIGPVLERLQDELLDPLVARAFAVLQRARVLPDAPEALVGADISVEYVSLLAQAQRLVTQQNVDRLIDTALGLANADPTIVQKLNIEAILESYADALGVDPKFLKTQKEFAALLHQQQQQQQQQQQMAAASQMADVAKTASQTQLEKPSGLSELMRRGGLM